MELRQFVNLALERVKQGTDRAVADLTPGELSWQPKPESNSVGFLLYHMARTEDRFVSASILSESTVWVSGKWAERLGIPESDSGGFGYTAERLASFPMPRLSDLQEYAAAVRSKTCDTLDRMTMDKTDEIVKVGGPFGDVSMGTLWAIIYSNVTQHAGEISYVRGLLRGVNK